MRSPIQVAPRCRSRCNLGVTNGGPRFFDHERVAVMERARFLVGSAAAIALAVACGDQGDPAAPASRNLVPEEPPASIDAGTNDASDAGDAAPPRDELASGVRLVPRPAMLAGVTSDGFVVFVEQDGEQRATAKVIALDGGAETTIATSTGAGKDDLRYAIQGKVAFVWSDRADRASTLTMWSQATGVVTVGPNVRPGRAAATADGQHVLYVRDVTDAGAKVVAGPSDGGATTTLATLSVEDDCWRGVDLATAGARLVARYCPAPSKAFTLTTFDPATKATTDLGADVTSAAYGASRLVWSERSGALRSAEADGTGAATLASADTAEYALAGDRSIVVYRTKGGALVSTTPDGGAPKSLVEGALQLGAVSRTGRALLFATTRSDAGATDVKALRLDDGGVATVVEAPRSCVNCLFDSFDDAETRVLVLDPIDADGVGPVKIADLVTGAEIATVGTRVITAASYGDAGPDAARFVFLDSTPDPTLTNGAAFGITTRTLTKDGAPNVIAKGTENLVIEIARRQAVFSFAAGKNEGVWVAPLDP